VSTCVDTRCTHLREHDKHCVDMHTCLLLVCWPHCALVSLLQFPITESGDQGCCGFVLPVLSARSPVVLLPSRVLCIGH
jgi:hypothetical protein